MLITSVCLSRDVLAYVSVLCAWRSWLALGDAADPTLGLGQEDELIASKR